MNEVDIKAVLSEIKAPYLQQDLMSIEALKSLSCDENSGAVAVTLQWGYPALSQQQALRDQIEQRLKASGVSELTVHFESKIHAHRAHDGEKPLPNVKNVIAVSSCKGGVGKSTTAVNLALALHVEGARVGLLDADIYGPSQPQMLGIQSVPEAREAQQFKPIIRHGLQSMSIGYLVDVNTPMIWRGPMVSGALQQLLYDTQWDDLDYLVVDLPPGTGDIQLTLAQKLPLSGAVLVTTPQDIALRDAVKGLAMFRKVHVPVLGLIENMSIYICPHCQTEAAIFGEGGGARMATEERIELLGALPLDINIRKQADSGTPTVVAEPQSPNAQRYRAISGRLAAKLSLQAKTFSHKFPKITIRNHEPNTLRVDEA